MKKYIAMVFTVLFLAFNSNTVYASVEETTEVVKQTAIMFERIPSITKGDKNKEMDMLKDGVDNLCKYNSKEDTTGTYTRVLCLYQVMLTYLKTDTLTGDNMNMLDTEWKDIVDSYSMKEK